MALRLGRRFLSAKVIRDIDSYEALKGSSKVMVGWFDAHFSTAGKLYGARFDEMAKSYPNYTFYKIDVDEVPRAAYDMEVEDVPSIAVMPIGLKPNGAEYDKTDLQVVKADCARYDQVLAQAKEAIDSIQFGEGDVADRGPWKFDPSTGTTLPPSQSY